MNRAMTLSCKSQVVKVLLPRIVSAMALVCSLAGAARAWDSSDTTVEELSTLSSALVTPHTPWARPAAAGPLRVLWFVASPQEGMQTAAREAAELRQRLDMDLDVVFEHVYYTPHFFGGLAGMRRISRLLDEPHDLFVFQHMTPVKVPTWPDEAGERFAKQVREGAGVLIIGHDVNKPGKDAVDPIAAREETAVDGFLTGVPVEKAATFGKGRVLQVTAPPFIPFDRDWEVAFDRWQERLVRAADQTGTELAIETEPGQFIETSAALVELLDEVDHPRLGANLDIGHAVCMGENPADSVRLLGRRLKHLHLEDIKDRRHYHLIPGLGDMDFASVRQALDEVGYSRAAAVELYTYADEPDRAVREAFAALSPLFMP